MTPKPKEELRHQILDWKTRGGHIEELMLIIDSYHQQQLERAVREAIIKEWGLIHETLHSADIEAELYINKIAKDRIAELQSTIKEDKSNE